MLSQTDPIQALKERTVNTDIEGNEIDAKQQNYYSIFLKNYDLYIPRSLKNELDQKAKQATQNAKKEKIRKEIKERELKKK